MCAVVSSFSEDAYQMDGGVRKKDRRVIRHQCGGATERLASSENLTFTAVVLNCVLLHFASPER